MLGVFEAEAVGHLRDGLACRQPVLGKPDDEATDMVARRVAGRLLDDVAEVVGRHAEPVGAILHGGQAERQLELVLEIVAQQAVETDEDVGVLNLSGDELAVVEPLAEVERQLDVADEDGLLQLVGLPRELLPYLAHQRDKEVVLLVGHVQGLVDAVVEEGILPDAPFEREAVQQVGMEQERPARNRHPLAVVLLAAHLPGSHAEQRPLVVIVLAAAIIEVHAGIVPEEQPVHAVIVQAVAYGRHLGIVDDADQRVLLRASDVAAVIIHVPYLQYLAHRSFRFNRYKDNVFLSHSHCPLPEFHYLRKDKTGAHRCMKDKTYLLFDLDGTLTDPFIGITRSVQHALKHYGIIENDLGRLAPFIGPPLVDSFRETYHFSEEQAKEAVNYYREYFAEKGWCENRVYPGIPELLKHLQEAGRKLYVATSKPTPFAKKILDYFNLSCYFERIEGASLDHTRTRKTEVMQYLLAQTGIPEKENAVMIGDRKFDVAGAHEVGMECIGVLYGYGSREELISAGADYIVPSVEALSVLFC